MSRRSLFSWFIEQIAFRAGDLLLGTSVITRLNKHRKITRMSASELRKLQLRKLSAILQHTRNVSYYRNLHIDHDNSDPIKLLKRFPLLTKDTLRLKLNELTVDNPPTVLIPYETSGSSGIPAKVWLDKDEESEIRAILLLWWEWCGYHVGEPILQTGMTLDRGVIKTVKDYLTRTHYMNAFRLKETEIISHLRQMPERGAFLGGYASSLYELANAAEKSGISIHFKAAISWGDKMFGHYQNKIERVFHTRVFENYSCNEGCMIAQKADLPYFYIYTPNIFLEILDDQGNEVPDGIMGRVVVTKLDGFVTPLIRYETGDLAIKLPESDYPANRQYAFPLLQFVVGRDTDIIKDRNGAVLIVHTFTGIFEFYQEIRQWRIIQDVQDDITIEYIPTPQFQNNICDEIEKRLRNETGTVLTIHWKQVSEIPSTSSGKPQLVLNNMLRNRRN